MVPQIFISSIFGCDWGVSLRDGDDRAEGRGEGEEDRHLAQVGVGHLEAPHPGQEAVTGGGARGAHSQDRPVLLLVHARLPE